MKPCARCGTEFQEDRRKTGFCSKECRLKFYRAKAFQLPAIGVINEISTSTVGTIGELMVAIDLLQRGLHVFRALSPACCCDLAVIGKDGKLVQVEVRTARRTRNGRMFCIENTKADVVAMVVHGEGIFYKGSLAHSLTDDIYEE
jgi:hypothetical protein